VILNLGLCLHRPKPDVIQMWSVETQTTERGKGRSRDYGCGAEVIH
jgi:hypothetical protein